MLMSLLLGLACESATPLPPTARETTPVQAQMVEAGEIRGYLVRSDESSRGVLLLVPDLGESAQSRAKMFIGSTVLAISPPTDIGKSKAYLAGMDGIEEVTILCDREECPGVTAEAGRARSPSRGMFARPSQSSDQSSSETTDR